MPIKKASHCAYDIRYHFMHYHFMFAVKYRRAVLETPVVMELVRISQEIGERYEIEIECLGADKDHVHLLCSAHPKMAPGQIARIYKSLTTREVFLALPQLRKRLWGGQFWSESYYVETVAQRGSWAALLHYVKQQGQKLDEQNLRLWFPED